MSVNEVVARKDYTANGVLTDFTFTVPIYATTDLEVLVDGVVQTLDTAYTVREPGGALFTSLADTSLPSTGLVRFATAPADQATVTLLRKQAAAQASDYTPNEAFPHRRLEKDLDKVVMRLQQDAETLTRALRAPKQSVGFDGALPAIVAGQYLRANAAGDGVEFAAGDLNTSTFTQSGTGAVARTVTAKLGEIVSAKDFGAKGDGVTDDTAALQTWLDHLATTGGQGFLPKGTYVTSAPLTVEWTATPRPGLPEAPLIGGLFGEGPKSEIRGTIATSGRAVLELLGESNTRAVSMFLRDLRLKMSGGDAAAWCLRVGDAKHGFSAERVVCEGANGARVKLASTATYAQLSTVFRECVFNTFNTADWFADDDLATVFALTAESGGASWDNVLFSACTFIGTVETRATIAEFQNCQFAVNPERPVAPNNHGNTVNVRLGSATFRSCYFEDHKRGVFVTATIGDIYQVAIRDCYFAGVTNFAGATTENAVRVDAPTFNVWNVVVEDCLIADVDAGGSPLYTDVAIREESAARFVARGLTNHLKPDTAVRMTLSTANFGISTTEVAAPIQTEHVAFALPSPALRSATASLDFGAINAHSHADLTITVPGAADGDPVILGVPNALASTAGLVLSGFVSAADTVTVRALNVTTGATADLGAATVRAVVLTPTSTFGLTATGSHAMRVAGLANTVRYLVSRPTWVAKVTLELEAAIVSGTLTVQVTKNGVAAVTLTWPDDFTVFDGTTYLVGYARRPAAGVFAAGDQVGLTLVTSALSPTGFLARADVELAF